MNSPCLKGARDMKRFLIVGGETFIGASLARRLVKEGREVHLITLDPLNLWRIKDLMLSVRIHNLNLSEPQEVFDVLNRIKASVIINTISYGENPGDVNVDEIYDQNFFNLLILMKQAKEVGFACFINTGSFQEYGRKPYALSETTTLEPLSHFGISKASATMYCTKEAKLSNLPIYTIRPFVPYGPYQSKYSFFSKLFINTMIDVNFNHYYANAAYDFIHIDDLVNIYLTVINQQPSNNFVFNAGSGTSHKLRDIVKFFEEIWQHNVTVDWNLYSDIGYSTESAGNCFADQTNVNLLFGSQLPAQKELSIGIKETFEWFLKNQLLYEDHRLDQRNKIQTYL
jgi:UDP-glucose 4-epimerase